MRFLKFCIVGTSGAVVSYCVYFITLFLLRYFGLLPSADYQVAAVMAFILSVPWSFFWNRKVTFESGKRSVISELLHAYFCYAASGIILNNILLFLWVDILGISKLIAPLINAVLIFPINYVLNKKVVFKN